MRCEALAPGHLNVGSFFSGKRRVVLSLSLLAAGVVSVARGQVVTEFPVPTSSSGPSEVTAGLDGNLWFVEQSANQIGRITPAGVVTEFPIPTANSGPVGIAAGADGNLWFTESAANQVGRITPAGVVTEFPIPTAGSGPWGIAGGPDGNLWFTESTGNQIGRITTAGVVTEFPIPTLSIDPRGITTGPDGNLWFTESAGNQIGRITTAGVVTEFPIPTANSNPRGITAGRDGNLWFTESTGNQIGQITTSGVVTEFPIPTPGSGPMGIAAGPDGNLWFAEQGANQIGRISPGGIVTEFAVPVPGGGLPPPWLQQDIGPVGLAGSASYSAGTFTVNGSGADIEGTADEFHYVYQSLSGDGTILARVASITNTDSWAKGGVMIRETLDPDSTHAMVVVTPGNGVAFQRRVVTGGLTVHTPGPGFGAPYWVKVVRSGDTLSGYSSGDGINWTLVGSDTIVMATDVFFGFPVTSHNNTLLCTATFDSVSPTAGSLPTGIVAGPDGNLWFTEAVGNNIGQITTSPATPQPMAVDAHAVSGSNSNTNGVLEPGETVQIAPAWKNTLITLQTFTGAASNLAGPPGPTYNIDDATSDYGLIGAGATVDCNGATGDCYLMTVSGARPADHWDATFTEDLSPSSISKVWTLHVGESFADVPTSDQFYAFIENLFHNGITGGCGGGNYCPTGSVTRGQMAVFLMKSKLGAAEVPPPATGTLFADVPASDPFAAFIEQLAGFQITGGCGNGNYCPNDPVTRAQMAVFLLKSEHGSAYTPPPCSGMFGDVICPSLFADWIEQLAAEQITGGCGGGNYCPNSPNTRGQMAVFLVKTFGLLTYGP